MSTIANRIARIERHRRSAVCRVCGGGGGKYAVEYVDQHGKALIGHAGNRDEPACTGCGKRNVITVAIVPMGVRADS